MKRACLYCVVVCAFGQGLAAKERTSDPRDGSLRSQTRRSVTGPTEPINEAIAAGATATITLQPVAPNTVPASSYPPGSSIVGQTLTLGSVPARVWIEVQITSWAPDVLKTCQVAIDATDVDGDGGGYDGDNAECFGSSATGAGDLVPAIVPCSGICQGTMAACITNQDCINLGTSGPCTNLNATCRAQMSGIAAPCGSAEPSRCVPRPPFFPPGGHVCDFAFQNRCHPHWAGLGIAAIAAVDLQFINTRFAVVVEPGEEIEDYEPTYLGTLVLDVPQDARGTYRIDLNDQQTFLQDPNAINIPIAELNAALIGVSCGSCCTDPGGVITCTDGVNSVGCQALPTTTLPTYRPDLSCDESSCCDCDSNIDCNDGDACTQDICTECLCAHAPVASWNPASECCDPMSGVQSPIPPSTPCRIGGCTGGGSSGAPMFTNLPDGTDCISQDLCDLPGECASGVCDAEEYAGSNCPKARFISFDIDPGSDSRAYRVRLVSLHHPVPPYFGGLASDFTSYEGEYRWVGDVTTYVESSTNSSPVHSAVLGCDPFYRDWSLIDLLHVTGSAVVPSSVYEVQSIAEGLDVHEESNYSSPVTIVTGRWGDLVYPYNPPSATVQPDATDHAALTDKFRSVIGAVSKPRALLTGSGMTDIPVLTLDVDFAEISACLDAFRGRPYPYSGPTPCP